MVDVLEFVSADVETSRGVHVNPRCESLLPKCTAELTACVGYLLAFLVS
jgi:hypothetical protein